MQNKTFQLNFSSKYKKDIDGVARDIYRFIASTETIDRAGEVILLSAWDFSNYDKHPLILDTHKSWEIEHIVGKCIERIVTEKEFIIDVLFSEVNPKGAFIENMLEEKMPIATSVGFIPKERENRDGVTYITKAELLEVSMVVLPCNPEAVQTLKTLAVKHNVNVKDLGVAENTTDEIVTTETKTDENPEPKAETIDTTTEEKIEEVVEEDTGVNITDEPKKETPKAEDDTEAEIEVEDDDEIIELELDVTDEDDEDEDDEEIEVEVEDDEVIDDVEIEVTDDDVDNSGSDTEKSMVSSEIKEGRKLSQETLATISQIKSFAEEGISNFKKLVATLDDLVGEAGDKTLLEDFITLRRSDLKDLQTKVRSSDKTQDEALSIINKLFKLK